MLCELCDLWVWLGAGDARGDTAALEDAPDALDRGLITGKLDSIPSSPGSFATIAVISGPFWKTCTSDLGLGLFECGSEVMLMLVTFFFDLLTVMQLLSLLLTECSWTEINCKY